MRARVASAGTGKTTSLVARYLELIDGGMPLRRIAGVTFTRAAANELRQRVGQGVREALATGSYLGGLFTVTGRAPGALERAERELAGALLTTIHGFMGACLRLNAPRLGLDPAFAVITPVEALALFEEELRSLELLARDPAHELHAPFAREEVADPALHRELFKARSLSEDLVFGQTEGERAVGAVFEAVYRRYVARLGGQSLDPGEIERRALRMLDVPAATERLARRFPVLLVDEFQDVNPLQGRFFERLAEAGTRLEVVGDPKQSIYLFRGAYVGVFRRALASASESGELLEPLTETRRSSRAVVRFLNRLTQRLAAAGRGFSEGEAPDVSSAGSQAQVEGGVELLIIEGDAPLNRLREVEAALLAQKLLETHRAAGTPFESMAIVARTHRALVQAQEALTRLGVPSLMLKGRGFYWRSEVRDVYHALSVGLEPDGPSLAAFLRGPFAALTPEELATVVTAAEPVTVLTERHQAVAARVRELGRIARLPPVEAIRQVGTAPMIDGKRFVDFLARRERDNLDALLLDTARRPPADIEALLAELDELALANEHAVVPEGGAGVRLMTVHASKGLEFSVVAIFNAGGGQFERSYPVLVDPRSGAVTLHAFAPDQRAQAERRALEEQESYRLLYVAASRARDRLLVSLSVSRRKPQGWAGALLSLGLEQQPLAGVAVTRGGSSAPARRIQLDQPASETTTRAAAPWIDERVPSKRFTPLMSPSRLVDLLKREGDALEVEEPLTLAETELGPEPEVATSLSDEAAPAVVVTDSSSDSVAPGRGRALGTLVHYAISKDWLDLDARRRDLLGSQEAAWPFSDEQRAEILDEVADLIGRYRDLLGSALPPLETRTVDRAEVPLALGAAGTVWEGIIDRLYQVDGRWVVEDYKTDRRVAPERYHVQLGLYLHAMERVLGERPLGRLVYLRSGRIEEPDAAELDAALVAAGVL
ncbi:MAG: UvrD-helicase domain-containing protein [Trueperaceae bacterium]|nr:UvrD-helicase domain-containing protein [Trueperaceae bacterium]